MRYRLAVYVLNDVVQFTHGLGYWKVLSTTNRTITMYEKLPPLPESPDLFQKCNMLELESAAVFLGEESATTSFKSNSISQRKVD
jgi:hypothetical protein